jgi:transcriptional regulator with XRE-family HTH domain
VICYDGVTVGLSHAGIDITGRQKMTFGEKLYQLRKAQGLSQEALAEKLNTSRQAVSKWENNNGYPETEKIIMIGRLFQVDLDDLLMEENEIGGAEKERIRQKENGYYVNRETANGFLLYYKRKFFLLAAACGLIVGCNGASFQSIEPGFFELKVEPFLTTVSVIILIAIVIYILLKQNPYRTLRKKEFIFAEEVRNEIAEEFHKMRKILIAGIIICLIVLGASGIDSDFDPEILLQISDADMIWDTVIYMILAGICSFGIVFCTGIYWSYAVLLRRNR